MAGPQSGVLPDANGFATFITYLIKDAAAVGAVLRDLPGLTDEIAARAPKAKLTSVAAVGADAWDRLFDQGRPAQLRPFKAIDGADGRAPATPADLLVHIRGDRRDLNFELARQVTSRLGDSASVVEEIDGFRYFDSRDLTGFVDGTENPTGDDRAEVALVGDADSAFAGGSYIAVQRYIHDLAAWDRLSVAEQEQVIARTKADNVEFKSDDKPLTSHIKRVSLKEDGKSLEILRHSMPYGTSGEHGLYFIAYCATPDNFDKMLESMLVGDGEGHTDHLMTYSHAVTGASFFAPARDWLEAL